MRLRDWRAKGVFVLFVFVLFLFECCLSVFSLSVCFYYWLVTSCVLYLWFDIVCVKRAPPLLHRGYDVCPFGVTLCSIILAWRLRACYQFRNDFDIIVDVCFVPFPFAHATFKTFKHQCFYNEFVCSYPSQKMSMISMILFILILALI